jgi:hypothetical protein
LESGLDAVVMAHRRLVYYQPDAYSKSDPHAGPHSNSGPHADASANSNTDSRHGMQRNSDLDCHRDLHGRSAGYRERLHL